MSMEAAQRKPACVHWRQRENLCQVVWHPLTSSSMLVLGVLKHVKGNDFPETSRGYILSPGSDGFGLYATVNGHLVRVLRVSLTGGGPPGPSQGGFPDLDQLMTAGTPN